MMLNILVSTALRLLVVGCATWLVLRLVRTGNPHVEVLVWRMLLLAGFALPFLLYWKLAPSFNGVELPAILVGVGIPRVPNVSARVYEQTANLLLVILSIYLAVTLVHLARLAAGLAGTWLVSRGAVPMATADDVRISGRILSPATFGRTILLPPDAMDWPAERLETVLAHERAHVRSRDGYWSWLAQLQAAIFWINPFSWWLWRRLDRLAETTSDDAVVAARHDPLAYAALLLDFARKPNSRRVVMSVADSNVSERIERLLARTPPGRALPRVARWTALALLVPAVVIAASTTRAASPVSGTVVVAQSTPPANAHDKVLGVIRNPANPEDYYPAVAKQERVEGSVVVEVDVDALGQLVDARVLNVKPADPRYGFADAALQVARNTKYGAPYQQPSTFKFMVKFSLKD